MSANNTIAYNITQKKIQYSNDFEYRAWMRRLFCMTSPEETKELDSEIDEVSRDEMDYDDTSSSLYLDHIYESTYQNSIFQQLYQRAAALMLSEDKSIGLCVLFSYDYFQCFHECLCCFFETPDEFTENHPTYVRMREKIG